MLSPPTPPPPSLPIDGAECPECADSSYNYGLPSERTYPVVVYVLPFSMIVLVMVGLVLYLLRLRRLRERAERREREFGVIEMAMPKDAITLAVQSLPTHTFNGGEPFGRNEQRDVVAECRLCLEDYVEGETLRSLPCGHVFHAECIDRWLAGKRRQSADCGPPRGERKCPLCMRDPLNKDCLQAAASALRASRRYTASIRGVQRNGNTSSLPPGMSSSVGTNASGSAAAQRQPYWRFLVNEVLFAPILPGVRQPNPPANQPHSNTTSWTNSTLSDSRVAAVPAGHG